MKKKKKVEVTCGNEVKSKTSFQIELGYAYTEKRDQRHPGP